MEMPVRLILNNWLPGDKSHYPGVRAFCITTFNIGVCMAIAVLWSSGSADMIVVTAATGVFMASYVLPIGNHFLLYFGM